MLLFKKAKQEQKPLEWPGLSGKTDVKDFVIPEGITDIPEGAFANCYNLHSVTMPNSVVCIHDEAFSGCSSLSQINFPANLEEIGKAAFEYDVRLEELDLSKTKVYSIGAGAFDGCRGLVSAKLPDGIDTIEASTFRNCKRLSDVELPNDLHAINTRAFRGCDALTDIYLPENLYRIGEAAFKGSGLTGVTIPPKCEFIESEAFEGCNRLKYVNAEQSSLNYVGERAMADCPMLDSICLPEGCTCPVNMTDNSNAEYKADNSSLSNAGYKADDSSLIDAVKQHTQEMLGSKFDRSAEYKADDSSLNNDVDYGLG